MSPASPRLREEAVLETRTRRNKRLSKTRKATRAKGQRPRLVKWGDLSHDGLWRGGEAFEVRFQAPKIRFSFTAPPPRSFQPPHNPRPAPTPPPLSVSLSLSLSFLIRRRPHSLLILCCLRFQLSKSQQSTRFYLQSQTAVVSGESSATTRSACKQSCQQACDSGPLKGPPSLRPFTTLFTSAAPFDRRPIFLARRLPMVLAISLSFCRVA